MVFSVSRLSASCASGDLEGKTNDLASVMKERLDRRSVVVAVHGPKGPGLKEQDPAQEQLQKDALERVRRGVDLQGLRSRHRQHLLAVRALSEKGGEPPLHVR